MKLLYEAMIDILKPLNECGTVRFRCNRAGNERWICLPLLLLNCRDVIEGQDMSCMKHDIAKRSQCVRFVTTMTNIRS